MKVTLNTLQTILQDFSADFANKNDFSKLDAHKFRTHSGRDKIEFLTTEFSIPVPQNLKPLFRSILITVNLFAYDEEDVFLIELHYDYSHNDGGSNSNKTSYIGMIDSYGSYKFFMERDNYRMVYNKGLKEGRLK